MPHGCASALPPQLGLMIVAVPPPLKLPGAPRFSCHFVIWLRPVLMTYAIAGLDGSTATPRGPSICEAVEVPQLPTVSSSALVPLLALSSVASSNTCRRQPA